MNMKKVSVAMMVMMGLGMSSAQASDGTLNFTGSVASATCSVEAGSCALAVDFGAITRANITALGSSGVTTPGLQKPISIKLAGCPESASTAKINFEGPVSSYNPNVFATGGTGKAMYVGAIIQDQAGNVISANTFDGEFNSKVITPGNNTLTYLVGLTRTTYSSNPTVGTVDIPVTYTLSYQ